jgi:hypothetical protein
MACDGPPPEFPRCAEWEQTLSEVLVNAFPDAPSRVYNAGLK